MAEFENSENEPLMVPYSSKGDTLEHIRKVNKNLLEVVKLLLDRAIYHDESKLHPPEVEIMDLETPFLKDLVYGSTQYYEAVRRLGPAIEHHRNNNSHHPEFYGSLGINGMDLIDLLEMFCDWKAASERTKDGSFLRSLEINKDRFKMSDQLYQIFLNTKI